MLQKPRGLLSWFQLSHSLPFAIFYWLRQSLSFQHQGAGAKNARLLGSSGKGLSTNCGEQEGEETESGKRGSSAILGVPGESSSGMEVGCGSPTWGT